MDRIYYGLAFNVTYAAVHHEGGPRPAHKNCAVNIYRTTDYCTIETIGHTLPSFILNFLAIVAPKTGSCLMEFVLVRL